MQGGLSVSHPRKWLESGVRLGRGQEGKSVGCGRMDEEAGRNTSPHPFKLFTYF